MIDRCDPLLIFRVSLSSKKKMLSDFASHLCTSRAATVVEVLSFSAGMNATADASKFF